MLRVLPSVLLVLFVLGATSASAAYRHPAATTDFGSDGTAGTTIGGASALAFNQANDRLYVGSELSKLYGFDVSVPGVYAPLGGVFPMTLSDSPNGLEVDSSTGNLYYLAFSGLYGMNSAGTPLSGFPIPRQSLGPEPCGIGLDPGGDVWVGDSSRQSLTEYDSSGEKLRTVPVSGGPCRIAFDSNDDLYVSYYNAFPGVTRKYTAASNYSGDLSTQVDPSGVGNIAVDRISHTLYVLHSEAGNVVAYNSDGAQLETISTAPGFIRDLAVDEATGDLFMLDASAQKVRVFPGVVVPDLITGGPGPVGDTVTGHIDPLGAGAVTGCEFQYGPTKSYGSSVPCSPGPDYADPIDVSGTLPGLTPETPYHYRIVASNGNGTNFGDDRTLIPHFVKNLTTAPATNLTKESARLNATFNGNGQDTDYYFEWGPTTAYGNVTAAPPGEPASSSPGPQTVSFDLSGLQSDSVYHYRIVASNEDGASVGLDREFSTQNAVIGLTTGSVGDLTGTGATIGGSWTGDGTPTHFYFEWGFNATYGNRSAIPPGTDAGESVGPEIRSVALANLFQNTTYHYRIVASNPAGTSFGADKTFKTLVLPTTSPQQTTDLTTSSATVNALVNPTSGGPTTYHFEYGTTESYGSSTPESAPVGSDKSNYAVSETLEELLPGTTYHFQIVVSNPTGTKRGLDQTFTTVPNSPTISSASPSGVTAVTATLNAQVRPGFGPTVAYFQYGPTTSYGATTPPGPPLNDNDSEQLVSTTVSGLSPGTTYHFRAIALNFGGAASTGDRTFTTADRPKVDGVPVLEVGETSATVRARINPSRTATTYHFEYGTGESYGLTTPESQSLGAGNAAEVVTTTLVGLSPGTTYHYRVVAANTVGSASGVDATFTTVSATGGSGKPAIKCKRGFVKRGGKCTKRKKPRQRHGTGRKRRGSHDRG